MSTEKATPPELENMLQRPAVLALLQIPGTI
jgi:hypothetical protein